MTLQCISCFFKNLFPSISISFRPPLPLSRSLFLLSFCLPLSLSLSFSPPFLSFPLSPPLSLSSPLSVSVSVSLSLSLSLSLCLCLCLCLSLSLSLSLSSLSLSLSFLFLSLCLSLANKPQTKRSRKMCHLLCIFFAQILHTTGAVLVINNLLPRHCLLCYKISDHCVVIEEILPSSTMYQHQRKHKSKFS